jgi:phage terminase large subunit
MAERIIIPYSPREWAKQLHDLDKRWKVIVSHRRSGKTVSTLNHLIREAIKEKESKYAYVAPTYKQAKNIAWDYLKFYSRPIPNIKINESELRIDYPNGSRITLFGADNPDSLRGLALWGVVFDEYSQQPSNIFTEIIRPSLADHKGFAIWIGTPKGKNEFYRLYEAGRNDDNWLSMLLTADDTGLIPNEELEDARKVMTDDEFQQEWYCSFEAAIKGAYYAKEIAQARADGRIRLIPYDTALKVHTVWDLGVRDATSIGFFQNINRELRLIDYYENNNQGLSHYAKIIKDKSYVYGKHFAPHDIEVKELGTGKTRREMAKELGVEFEVIPNIPIIDGINAGRLLFSRFWINEQCTQFIDAISQYRKEWDDNRGDWKPQPLHDWTSHAADMYRYVSIVESKMSNEESGFQKTMRNNEINYIENEYE